MEPVSLETKGRKGSLENPEVYENVPGHVIPIVEREFDDFDNEAEKFLAGDTPEDQFIGFRLKQGVHGLGALLQQLGGPLGPDPDLVAHRPHGSGSPHGLGPHGSSPAFSNRPVRSQGFMAPACGAGGGVVSRRNCSIAAAIAAASWGDAADWRISIRGRRGACLPFRDTVD